MDSGYKITNDKNPQKKANIISKLFFAWMGPLFYKGSKKGLEVVDLYKTLKSDRSDTLGDILENNWKAEEQKAKLKNKTPSLFRALTKTFLWGYMKLGFLLFFQMMALRSVQPIALAGLIRQFSLSNENSNETKLKYMYIYGGVLIVLNVLYIFFMHHVNARQSLVGMRIRVALSSLVYRKITKLNQKALGQTAAGQVVNLLSNDVNRFDMVTQALHYVWIMPFQVALVTYLIWEQVGISSLAGVISMAIISLPGQGYLGKLTGQLRLKVANKTDYRVKLMSEVISGIQVIKMYAWEKPFEKIIKIARATEIDDLTTTSYLRGIFASCMVFIERATLFLSVICYVLLGNGITADKVFSMAQYFNILQSAMAIYYPMAISYGAESWVSIKRLQEFLLLDEKEVSKVGKLNSKEIKLSNVSAAWVPDTPVLNNLDIHIPPNKLCAIVGPVGSGKSSILQLLLAELPALSGEVALGGEISYSSQEPWLFASTVRNNILFGLPYDGKHYRKVVKVCALEKDFEQFSDGDKTLVGERGVSLSGGQRARINLARAVYREADIYLMDDPLSAVDTHVGKHLFEECIVNHLHGKTRVLVTHQLQYLKKADLIVVLNNGKVEAKGTFAELSHSKLDFTKMLVSADETGEKIAIEEKVIKTELSQSVNRKSSVLSIKSNLSDVNELSSSNMENDEESSGDTNISPFREYFKASGNVCLLIILILGFILAQAACSGADYWVSYWTNQEAIRYENKSTSKSLYYERINVLNLGTNDLNPPAYYTYIGDVNKIDNPKLVTQAFWDDWIDTISLDGKIYQLLSTTVAIYIYGILIILAIVFTIGRSLLYFKVCMLASKNLHSKMFNALLKAPMRFFDTNPSGRVLNRFSKDMGAIDETLPRVLLDSLQVILVMLGILVNVSVSNPWMVIAVVVLGGVALYLQRVYSLTAKAIKRLETKTKSPVFSHVNSSLNGIVTIRASKAEQVLIKEFDNHQDVHTSSWNLTVISVETFGLWLDIICSLFLFVICFSFILLYAVSPDSVNGSLVGLALSQAMILTGMVQYGMRQTAEVINQLISVERVLQYTELETESPFITPPGKHPELPWPNAGLVEFRNMSLKYVPQDPPVLKNLNITVLPGEKVGIVGRTGAGKSSLISALFRLAPIEGSILVDGVDTKTLGLTDLRKKISIIPQEPVLFSATLRYNLDPFGEFKDEQLWKALEEVELKDAASSLDFMVTEGGGNFSLGERQLICLARAILRNNRILVLDEATANVDQRTDVFIQTTIRRKFADCTVLTIAHRLNTIMDSDKVLVMGSGEMLEYDHPHKLLQQPEGHFHKMLTETGPSMTGQLKEIAHQAFIQKHGELDKNTGS